MICRVFLAAALLVSLLASCGGDERATGCAESCAWPARCDTAAGTCTTRCGADADCGFETLRCSSGGSCVAKCEGVICATGSLCEPATGACVADPDRACNDDASCGDGSMGCEAGVCVSRCRDVRCNVEAGEICNPSTGACVGGSTCTISDDCAGDRSCEAGICVGGRFARCEGGQPCAAGLRCVSSGEIALCTERCAAAGDCDLTDRCAGTDEGALGGHCLPNLCRPGGDALGFYQDAAFMDACDAAGSDDGRCVGPFGLGDEAYGVCMGQGLAAPGTACSADATHGGARACEGGVCAGAEDDGVGTCLPFCSLFDGEACPTIGGFALACRPLWGTNGACVAMVPEPAPIGAPCAPQASGFLACAEESFCVAEDGIAGGPLVCEPLCATAAEAGDAGACAAGHCQAVPANPALGICVGEGAIP